MDAAGFIIVGVNLALAFGCGWPIAVWFSRLHGMHANSLLALLVLLVVYLTEAVAFAAGMATDVLSIALAVVWGVLLGSWLPKSLVPRRHWRRIVAISALYSSLPAASFLTIPVISALGGWSILGAEVGARFGIPAFLPWPLNTILGFCVAVAGFAVVMKLTLTTTMAGHLIRRARHGGANASENRAT